MRYHIVGIAGAGMSAIAHVLLDQGHTIGGSDLQCNTLAGALAARGATIWLGHDAAHVAGADALVVTSAVTPDHPELRAARERGIPILKRTDLWREWSATRDVVAVAGTHGKTTTTAMIALALTRAGCDPGYLIGGEAPDLPRNARWGDPSAPLVIEADEYDRTFLALRPRMAVITNVEWDHVDIYASPEEYEAAFRAYAGAERLPAKLGQISQKRLDLRLLVVEPNRLFARDRQDVGLLALFEPTAQGARVAVDTIAAHPGQQSHQRAHLRTDHLARTPWRLPGKNRAGDSARHQ